MPICTLPTVRIYEDFDKISAKEVYFTDAGDKITVKLLHFPNLSPEEQEHLQNMSDSDEARGNVRGASSGATLSDDRQKSRKKSTGRKSSNEQRRNSLGLRKNSKEDVMVEQQQVAPSAMTKMPHHHPYYHHHHYHIFHSTNHHSHHHHPYQPQQLHQSRMSDFNNGSPASASLRQRLHSSNRSPSPRQGTSSLCPGYEQYQMSLLEVPMPRDYGDASSDDLSSEWDSDVPDLRNEHGAKVSSRCAAIHYRK